MVRLFDLHRRKIYKPFKRRFNLNGYQMSWLAFGKGLIIGALIL